MKRLISLILLLLSTSAQAYFSIPICEDFPKDSFTLIWGTRTHLWKLKQYVYCDYFDLVGTAAFHINGIPILYCYKSSQTFSCCIGNPELCGTTKYKCDGEELITDCHYLSEIKSSFLVVGENKINFELKYLNPSEFLFMDEEQLLSLAGPDGFYKDIYTARWDRPQSVSISFNLAWDDVNSSLAHAIRDLISKIDGLKIILENSANESQTTLDKLNKLNELSRRLDSLFEKGVDGLTLKNLNDILNSFDDDFPNIRRSLESVIKDLQGDLGELRKDLTTLSNQFTERTEKVTSGVLNSAADYGYNPKEIKNYSQEDNLNSQDEVDLPTISSDPPVFDSNSDQYAKDADLVIGSLQALTNGGKVTDRVAFINIVLIWKDNQENIKLSLRNRDSVATAEYASFLNAQQRVFEFISTYIDEDMWFRDTPIPLAIRKMVDDWAYGVDSDQKPWPYFIYARYLKYDFEAWYYTLTPAQALFLYMLPGTFDYIQAVAIMIKMDEPEEVGTVLMATDSLMSNLALVGARVGLGFVPIVGQILDFCEFVTGREFCSPGGSELSTFERSMSGLGVLVGNGAFWRVMAKTSKSANIVKISTEADHIINEFLKSGKRLDVLRHQYIMDVLKLRNKIVPMHLAGMSAEQIGKTLSAERRALGITYKNMTPSTLLEEIFARNIKKYGDPLGPSVEYFSARVAQGKMTWEDVIDSACRYGGLDLGF